MKEVYLDNAATTNLTESVLMEMNRVLNDIYGNPSSLHQKGRDADSLLINAKKAIAKKINANYENIIFTSNGTESNNIAIMGSLKKIKNRKRVITTCIEHPSVSNVFKYLETMDYEVKYLKVDKKGLIDLEELSYLINKNTALVSIMHVNNEIGSIQPIVEAGNIIKSYDNKILFHVDAIQSFCKLPIDVKRYNIDMLSMSAHKIHGPKGIAALYIKDINLIQPIYMGGKQEYGLKPGTENIPGIAGFMQAVKDYDESYVEKMIEIKKYFLNLLLKEIDDININGPDIDSQAPQILNISFKNTKSEVLMNLLDRDNIYISNGSACSSKEKKKSYVLKNIGLKQNLIDSAVRISFSPFNDKTDVEYAISKIKTHVKYIREIMG